MNYELLTYYYYRTFTIMQSHNFINFTLHHVYCNLVEYCNMLYCGTLCKLYYNYCGNH